MQEIIIGSHVSFQKDRQLLGSVLEALSYDANTFMFYTGAPQNTSRMPIRDDLTMEAYQVMREHDMKLENVIVHAPYIINLANNEKMDSYRFAITFLKQEIERCEALGMTKLVLHPGSFVKLNREMGIKNIIDGLNQVIDKNQKVDILLETMAGKGTELGVNFSELKKIIDGIKYSEKVKVCLDTCHLHDAGYDLTHFDQVLEEFDHVIGINKIGCIHINDSKNERGSKKDRHENIGLGTIGFHTLLSIIYHPLLKNIPKILETPYITPNDDVKEKTLPPYRFEIAMIRDRTMNQNLLKDIRNYYR